ncbi:2-oxoglutarate dehydrogenase E1 [Neoasaia chiangmaiensis NBRC 101099]|uniref:2-oxoglutarate dehydrogenase E1 component n=1 Tax=Neoasaia chiangmaiensis TaxID=320497 RepID=A0A1U9KS78_9PROT|nr:2-oxoglutarate dehydrogenase E1 component [Neoasaia chiangmaiensis]AQS88569.1 2-oxoglutarate dehydrogenase subunit E1 [Neoasaia chiangmaiensis]GBR36264.1 2-oxoglutarate dehydrogenase E1 [Neoasaia chiangmaiensis NBRC 101099]GEN15411.1 2-oxoglutarate dehydrogenase subunit E1 [Neoasaia chiangmaiensis]
MGELGVTPGALNGANTVYLADLHAKWARDPQSVDPSFAALFTALDEERAQILADADGADWAPHPSLLDAETPSAPRPSVAQDLATSADDSLRAIQMIRAYRVRGHLEARLDPLGLYVPPSHADLDPATYGFGPQDRQRPIYLGNMMRALLPGRDSATVEELIAALRETYCGPIGTEYMHIQDPRRRQWLQMRLEGDDWRHSFAPEGKRQILSQLTEAEGFESFCQKRFTGTKRFGLEGSEVTIPVLHAVIDQSTRHGTRSVSLGMAHRGRLNTMANIVQKPFAAIFSEFAGASFKPHDVQGSGDVKYHLGTAATLRVAGQDVRVSLLPNPSHLEAVDPVVVGRVRAIQDREGCTGVDGRHRHLGLLVHGDAAFAGQGIVYETMAMSQLIGYRTGGTIHVVINNQIGFTTISAHAYSGLYCTDIAKAVQAPIFHINGDEPEAAAYCARLAADYRREFNADIVLDLVCYRRHGHNEADEPAFTQPTMYKAIAARPTARTLYAKRLERERVVDRAAAEAQWQEFQDHLQAEFEVAKSYRPNAADWMDVGQDPTRLSDKPQREQPTTGIGESALAEIGRALTQLPDDFALHPRLKRVIQARADALEKGEGIDWATGEALAFGSFLLEGHRVRLSGEDCQRGTFSQRHAVLIDQVNQNEYVPLNAMPNGRAQLEVYNSLLSEFGVLGFEYGYTLADPETLVLWEAQFGDFANGAQVIIDQFIASGETKWLRTSGLVMLLPHGYEGQGPEHSSARLERYLQLCAENNLRVANITTPANYFHALRRQIHRTCRKPLVLMTPKSLLRHRSAVSPLSDFVPGTCFRTVIAETDPLAPDQDIERVVLCSGKVYYDLHAERAEAEVQNVAILRLEQLYPFPQQDLADELARYPNARVIWCQEEPENSGAWNFVDRRIEATLAAIGHAAGRPVYAGRAAAASPATGSASEHAAQQGALVAEALGLT